jgi:Protein kinase domain
MAEKSKARRIVATYGPFETIRELGRGAMGVVFLARRSSKDVPIALKVLPEVFTHDPVYPTKLLHLARQVSAMEHPNIVRVLDFGQDEDLLYVASQFIEGRSALEVSREHPYGMDWCEACRIVRQVAAGLAHAAARGVLHRDIKPANILVTAGTGRALINDLALAKVHMLNASEITGYLCTVGTPSYFSPELIRNDRALDHRADIYSLGAVLYRLVCGQPPFRGETALAVVAAHLTQPVPDPCKMQTKLPANVGELIRCMLAKDPAGRPQTYDALRESLADVMAGKAAQGIPGAAAAASAKTAAAESVLERLRFMDELSFEREDEPWYIFTDAPLTWADYEGAGGAVQVPPSVAKSDAVYSLFEMDGDQELELEDAFDRASLQDDALSRRIREMRVATAGEPSAFELETRTPVSESRIKTAPVPASEPEPADEDVPVAFMDMPVSQRRRSPLEWIMDNAVPLAIMWGIVVLALAAYIGLVLRPQGG